MKPSLDSKEHFVSHSPQDFLNSLNNRREFTGQELQCFDGISSQEVRFLKLPEQHGSETRILRFAFVNNDGGICLLKVDFLHGQIIIEREAQDNSQNEHVFNDILLNMPSYSPAAMEMYHTLQSNSISRTFDGKGVLEALEEVKSFNVFGMGYFPEIIFVDDKGNFQLVERQERRDGGVKSKKMRLTGDNISRLKKILRREFAYWSTNAHALRTEIDSAKKVDDPQSTIQRVKNAIWNLLVSSKDFEDPDNNPYSPPGT